MCHIPTYCSSNIRLLFCCNDVFTAHSINSGWLRSLLAVKDAVYDNNAIMLCAFFPLCFIHYLQPYPPSLLIQASVFYCPRPLLLFLPNFIPQIISCVVITFPFTHCALASCHCVFVYVFCLWWLTAGYWPLPLLGKLCLCPRGFQICATPEPQLQLWSQAGAKSLPPSPPPPSSPRPSRTTDPLSWVIYYLNSQGLYLNRLLSPFHASHVPAVTPFYLQLPLVWLSQFILSLSNNRPYLSWVIISAWCSSEFLPALHLS